MQPLKSPMHTVTFDCFPGGRRKALTMSYDDGTIHDRRLIEIFNRYGIRGTFHLNSGRLDSENFVSSDEVAQLYAGHEVAAHTVTHPCLPHLAREGIIFEVMEDRRRLEALVGYPVRGFAYPGGDFSAAVAQMLPTLGLDYARTTQLTSGFNIPEHFFQWSFNCHHSASREWAQKFLDVPPGYGLQMLQVMGHSYEFADGDNWDTIEEFCETMSNRPDIWYATHIEIVDYMNAVRSVRSSADGTLLFNPSSTEIWFSTGDLERPTGSIAPGATFRV
jgi:hypothetical protein